MIRFTNRLLLIAPPLLVTFVCYAQQGYYAMGAGAAGAGGTSTTLGDEWALFNNVGGLTYHDRMSVFIAYKNQYLIPEFSCVAAGFVLPVQSWAYGVGFFRFGDDLYNEQRINLGVSHQLGIVSLGFNLGYYQRSIKDLRVKNAFLIDFGGQARLTPQLHFGAYASNLNQAKASEATEETLPTFMSLGLSYLPHKRLMLNIEAEKELRQPARLKLGLAYQIIKNLPLRTGFLTQPFEGFFGFGFAPGKLAIDYAYGYHGHLGSVHQISMAYHIKKVK